MKLGSMISKLTLAALVAVGMVGCDNRIDVTVRGQGMNINKFFTLRFVDNKSPAEALAGSTWAGAVAWADVDAATKSPAAGADGKFELKFKAAPKTKFRLYVEGGDQVIPAMVQNELTVPDAAGTMEVGILPGDQRNDSVQSGAANILGQSVDDVIKQGTVMFGGLTKPLKLPEQLEGNGKTKVTVDNGFTVIDCCSSNNGTSASSDFGWFVITKKGNTTETEVTVTLEDLNTGTGHPYTWAPVKIKVKPNYSTAVFPVRTGG